VQEVLFNQLVSGGVDESTDVLDELDPWQRFAVDIILYHVQTRLQASLNGTLRKHLTEGPGVLRLILTGTSGSGKSRTIKAVVGQVRRMLRECNFTEEELLRACVLSAPTGTAAFQMRAGGGTSHRTYAVPIDYFGPLPHHSESFKSLRLRLLSSLLHILDEYSMLARSFLGKIGYRCEEVFGSAPEVFGGERVSMGGRDFVLAGDAEQMPPTGGEQLFEDGPYRGTSQNRPDQKKGNNNKGDGPVGVTYRGGGVEGPSLHELTHRGVLLRDEFEDAVILRNVWRLDDGDDSMSAAERAAYRAEADMFADVTAAMADISWSRSQYSWLAGFSRSALRSSKRGQDHLRNIDDGVLLMDCKKAAPNRPDTADTRNLESLQAVAEKQGVPIVDVRALHAKPTAEESMKPEHVQGNKFQNMEYLFFAARARACCCRGTCGQRLVS
jgi:hypothetical protein